MSAERILVVDDDPDICDAMRATLTACGYEVKEAQSGEEALEKLSNETHDLVLLDINMPGIGGMETCRRIRSSSEVSIIMLTVNNSETDKVDALNAGADDYVTKPFSMPELLARIRATLRRMPPSIETGLQKLRFDDIEIDFSSRQVSIQNRKVRLTPKEFELLSYFANRPNQTITHRELLQAIWGPNYGDELEYLRVFINRLRKKIEPDPANPRYLLTDAWIGYRFRQSI